MPMPCSPVIPNVVDRLASQEVLLAENQPEYIALPSIISAGLGGVVTTRWRFTWKERLQLLWSGNLWLQQMTFHRNIQPVKIVTVQPTPEEYL